MPNCLFCNKLFAPKRINNSRPQKYCCYGCSVQSNAPKKKNCLHCGKETLNPKYCSRSCSAISNNTGSTHAENTKTKISEKIKKNYQSLSDKDKDLKNKKRLDTYRKNNIKKISQCIECKKDISKNNKHKMCRSCYLNSDAARQAWGHFSKSYKKGYVFSPYANKNIYLLSGLEIRYANWLNENSILWDKPSAIPYILDGKNKKYFPDFLLIETNELIEIKGYWWNNDKRKMDVVRQQHPELRIKILTNKELDTIGAKSIRADTSL